MDLAIGIDRRNVQRPKLVSKYPGIEGGQLVPCPKAASLSLSITAPMPTRRAVAPSPLSHQKPRELMSTRKPGTAYIVGGGIASLSAAVLLIRDGGMNGHDIRILEEMTVAGGALDGAGDPVRGYVSRGGRMLTEETYVCLWNILESIPSLQDASRSVKDDIWTFNADWRSEARARLIDRHHQILDSSDLGFNLQDRTQIVRLLATPERLLSTKRIDECFSEHFF